VQVGREDHEAEIGPREHGEGDDLRLGFLPREGDEGFEVIERGGLLALRFSPPRGQVDAIKKMERAEALLRAERLDWCGQGCVFGSHATTVEQNS